MNSTRANPPRRVWRTAAAHILPALLLALVVLPSGSASAASCPNEALRSELGATQLPECRAYELVSPTTKDGWPVFVTHATGSRVVMYSLGGQAKTQNGLEIFNDLTRTTSGWEPTEIETPAGFFNPVVGGAAAETPDLTEGLFAYRRSAAASLGERDLYVTPLPGGDEEVPAEIGPMFSATVLGANPPSREEQIGTPSASADLSRVIFGLRGPIRGIDYLWPGDPTVEGNDVGGYGFESTYEYRGRANSVPSLVGVNDVGKLISQCGTSLGFPEGGRFGKTLTDDESYNAISADGAHAFFTSAAAHLGAERNRCNEAEQGTGPAVNELYDRQFSAGALHTIAISEPLKADCSACDTAENQEASGAVFQGASEDGSKVLFLSGQPLLAGAVGEKSLYEYDYDAAAGNRVRLIAPEVLGVARLSEDGSHTFFVSTAALTGTNHEGRAPTAGQPNLYASSLECAEGGTHCATPSYHTRFIATLSGEDNTVWAQKDIRPVSATPDGRFLLFTSVAPHLTSDDDSNAVQVFEYDATTETLTRVSHGQGGFNEDGNTSTLPAAIIQSDYSHNLDPASRLGSLSEDGSTIAFQSPLALTPQALNGVRIGTSEGGEPVYAENVYEWHSGQIHLISDGQDRTVGQGPAPSTALVGMDPSGQDIFFTSADELTPQDGDTQQDVYDARIDGGFPSPAAPACAGDGCQGPLPIAPTLPTPASTSLSDEAPAPAPAAQPPSSSTPDTAHKLAAALKACRRKHSAKRRRACERAAHHRYPLKKTTARHP